MPTLFLFTPGRTRGFVKPEGTKKASEGGTMPSSEAFLSALAQRDPLACNQELGLRCMEADWPQPSTVPGAVSLEVF